MKIFDKNYEYKLTFHSFQSASELIEFVINKNIHKESIMAITENSVDNITLWYYDLIEQ